MAQKGGYHSHQVVSLLCGADQEGYWLTRMEPASREHLSILALHGEPLFFQHFDGPYFPTLKILHKCESLVETIS